jgi:hypothetical protein
MTQDDDAPPPPDPSKRPHLILQPLRRLPILQMRHLRRILPMRQRQTRPMRRPHLTLRKRVDTANILYITLYAQWHGMWILDGFWKTADAASTYLSLQFVETTESFIGKQWRPVPASHNFCTGPTEKGTAPSGFGRGSSPDGSFNFTTLRSWCNLVTAVNL